MALKHTNHTISNRVYALDVHSYDWHNNQFFFLTNTRGRVILPETPMLSQDFPSSFEDTSLGAIPNVAVS